MEKLFVYRHKTEKNLYLMRNWSCCGGSEASHFYEITDDFKKAVINTLANDALQFERFLKTPYSFGHEVDDTMPFTVEKDMEFDGYKGTLRKELRYRLCDFEKVRFIETKE